jgi:glucose-6-phosphate 1-epimerase
MHIRNPLSHATTRLQGAKVLQCQALGEAPMRWQGVPESFVAGKAMRSGIPIFWPWIYTHPQTGYSAHGFVRSLCWYQLKAETLTDQRYVSW